MAEFDVFASSDKEFENKNLDMHRSFFMAIDIINKCDLRVGGRKLQGFDPSFRRSWPSLSRKRKIRARNRIRFQVFAIPLGLGGFHSIYNSICRCCLADRDRYFLGAPI